MSMNAIKNNSDDDVLLPAAVGPSNAEHSPFSVPDELLKGTRMLKVSEKKQAKVVFYLDPDEGQMLYKSSKVRIVPIETIKEIRSGANARYYRVQFKFPEEAEQRWITVIYILEGAYKTLHMLAESQSVFEMWDTSLRKLYAVRQGLMSGLDNIETRQTVWERQYWKGSDKEGDQKLAFSEVEGLCRRLNANLSTDYLQRLFKDADKEERGFLDFAGFQRFVKLLKKRTDIESLYARLCQDYGGRFDCSAFERFMRECQKSKLDQPQLQAIFSKFATHSSASKAEISTSLGSGAEPPSSGDASLAFSVDGFARFLISADNTVFSQPKDRIWQDMTHPISDYYVSSSHNTYLVGHQLVGVSTIEGYIRALLHGCRSVELDIYDGDDEPVVFHGRTLTSKVAVREVCLAIAKYAFVASPYPVIISAEVHCGLKQQDKLVEIMTEAFGDALVRAPIEGRPHIPALPSPEDLKGKILLKAKNLYVVAQLEALRTQRPSSPRPPALEAEEDSSSSDSEDDSPTSAVREGIQELKDLKNELKGKWKKVRGKDSSRPEKPKVKMSLSLASLLVYTVGVKCHGFGSSVIYAPEHIFSLSENSANKLLKASMKDLIKHTQTHVVRIYPKGTRLNSTNYEPHRFWAAGCQVVAINWQTFDLGYIMNQAMFHQNGRCGLILRPPALRADGEDLLAKHTKHYLDVTIISAQQLPRLKDANGQEIIGKSVVDPFVEVSLHIPDWTHSPFVSKSPAASGTSDIPPPDATKTASTPAGTVIARTHVVKNNGFNPVWDKKLILPFDCVGDMQELIFVKFTIFQEGKDNADEPIALHCAPLGCLESGYRYLPLYDSQLTQYLFSTLFVKIDICSADQ